MNLNTDGVATTTIMSLTGVTKRFGGVQALKGVDVEIRAGEVVALVGENGAGKSTLGKIIAGVHRPDTGEISVDGEVVTLGSPREALKHGIAFVAQELALVPEMSVVDNVFLGYESRAGVVVKNRNNRQRFIELQRKVGFDIDPDARAGKLRLAEQQKVEILRALARDARVVVMDEPTAALGQEEVRGLFSTVRTLTSQGTAVVFVSHFLDEVLELADTVVILKDGGHVRTASAASETKESLIGSMLGKQLEAFTQTAGAAPASAPVVLSVRGLSHPKSFTDISFDVKAGEIVGLAGLLGSGRTEVLRAIFRADRATGDVRVDGKHVRKFHPRHAMRHGVGMIPESRKDQGLVMSQSIRENITLASLPKYSSMGLVSRARERRATTELSERLGVRTLDDARETAVFALSGGNQQKVLFAKWLAFGGRVLLIDEPTRGVDVGAKASIHNLIAEVAAQGVAVVLVSSEHDEIVRLAHRVLVMRTGRIVEELSGDDVTESRIVHAAFEATGHKDSVSPQQAPESTNEEHEEVR